MNDLLLKIMIPVVLVGLATLAGRRWGNLATGLVGGLPIIAGPILYFYAVEQGPAFASQAAVATLLGMVSLSAFLLAYGWRSWTGGTALNSLGMGWAVFAVFTVLIDRVSQNHSVGVLKALVYALAAMYLGRRSLPPSEELSEPAPSTDPWDLPLRMVSAAALVLTLTAMARWLGPRLGGLLTAFPVSSSVLAVFSYLQGGREAVRAVLKGLFLAFNSYAVFCAVLAALLSAGGIGLGLSFAAAAAAAGLTQAFVFRRKLKSPAH